MKEIWSDEPGRILAEMHSIISHNTSISLQTKDARMISTRIRDVVGYNGKRYIVFHKPATVDSICDIINVYYKIDDRPVMCFPVSVSKEHGSLMASLLPEKIHFIQRRQFPRFDLQKSAIATVELRNNISESLKLENISCSGARLRGEITSSLQKADMTGPLTFEFPRMEQQQKQVVRNPAEFIIPHSTVVRNIPLHNHEVELGIRFDLPPAEIVRLTEYITNLSF